MKRKIAGYKAQYRDELFENVLPFWEKFSIDKEHGGYFTCLDFDGKVFDTDKFIWLQARQAWLFSMLYNKLEKKPEWLEMAKHGIDFLQKHGRDEEGNWYFSLNQKGQPLIQPYNVFSDCFASMAFSQYSVAAGDESAAKIAMDTYFNILRRSENPKGIYNKHYPGTRPLKNFSLPMILCNLCLELEDVLTKEEVDKTIETGVNEVMEVFLDKEKNIVFENVTPDGTYSDSFDGRLINPGHGIEAMWFIMDIAKRNNNKPLIEKAVSVVLSTLEYSWDDRYNGIFYFLDVNNRPPQQLEWDQKLWWVHLETLIALAKGYSLTGNHDCLEWFDRVHDFTWRYFPDPKNGEWYGYLNRRGEVSLSLKGGKWKGCFHVPRGLYQIWKTLESFEAEKNEDKE